MSKQKAENNSSLYPTTGEVHANSPLLKMAFFCGRLGYIGFATAPMILQHGAKGQCRCGSYPGSLVGSH